MKRLLYGIIGFFLLLGSVQAQTAAPSAVGKLDATTLKIGEKRTYTITVSVKPGDSVRFPEDQAFAPFEVIGTTPTDTVKQERLWQLIKQYAISQYDSGTYNHPGLRVQLDTLWLQTAPFSMQVSDVAVDTTKQKLYPAKPIREVERVWVTPLWMWILGVLALLGAGGYGLIYWRRKKKQAAEAVLDPLERALLGLEKLAQSPYLIREEYKAYYTELTGIVRAYLEDEVHISALESTSEELMEKLENLREQGKLALDQEALAAFDAVLKTADLVKFARATPERKQAELDRDILAQWVVKAQEALPEPTEEELYNEAQRLAALEAYRKARRKKLILVGSGIGVLALFVGLLMYTGPERFWDTVTFNPHKIQNESPRLISGYGFPSVWISTPDVLVRQDNAPKYAGATQAQLFAYTPDPELVHVWVHTLQWPDEKAPDFDALGEEALKMMETMGAKNILTEQTPHTTQDEVQGVQVFGQMDFEASGDTYKKSYALLLFGGNGFAQLIWVHWPKDEPYAATTAQEIIQSIQLKETP
ncbi:MAG: hypothetical protein NWS70_02660 [Flavobacteriaceae bacterium]|nr:hypothetical protein [Flavobacteriaceae bacterium]